MYLLLISSFPLSITHNNAGTSLGGAAIQQWKSVALWPT